MKSLLIILLGLIFFCSCEAQNSINVACKDFTFNEKSFNQGQSLRQLFEISLIKSGYPFKIVERDKMAAFFNYLQEEKNLYKDISVINTQKLRLAGVDYLIIGDMDNNIKSDQYSLYINFLKINGDNISEKLPMMITLTKNDIFDDNRIKTVFETELKAFVRTYFVLTKDTFNWVKVPEMFKELNKRDSLIEFLQIENSKKDIKISGLSNDIVSIKQYVNIAKMDIWGDDIKYGRGLVSHSELKTLMGQVLERKGNTVWTKFTDSAFTTIDIIIQKYPNFPFGYLVKAELLLDKENPNWLIYANKGAEIFKVTTTIEGHDPSHDQGLARIIELIQLVKDHPHSKINLRE